VKEVAFISRGEEIYGTLYGNSNVGVVLCPPHPLYGGSRNDMRLTKVTEKLVINGISAFCIDYGSYGRGVKEVQDASAAVNYLRKNCKSVGLFGYSFGAVIASVATAMLPDLKGLAVMAILKEVDDVKVDVSSNCPKLFVHGKYDDVAPYSDFEMVYSQASGRKKCLIVETGHFYMETQILEMVSKRIYEFFAELLM